MQVLLIESDRGAGDSVASALTGEGHAVVRCHEPGEGPWPCNAVLEDCECPLETMEGAPVDVAVLARRHPWPKPSPFESGATCAIRRQIPMVVAGVSALNPYHPWTDAVVADPTEVVAACEQAVAAPRRRLSKLAESAARDAVESLGGEAPDLRATVTRLHGRVTVQLSGTPALDSAQRMRVADAVRQAVRRRDRLASTIDVTISES